jgi:hypothetical protein
MVYNTQNYCFFFNFPLSGIRENRKSTIFRKLDLFPSSGEGGREDILSWVPQKELISITGPVIQLRMETDPVLETLCFLFSRIPDNGKSPKTQ